MCWTCHSVLKAWSSPVLSMSVLQQHWSNQHRQRGVNKSVLISQPPPSHRSVWHCVLPSSYLYCVLTPSHGLTSPSSITCLSTAVIHGVSPVLWSYLKMYSSYKYVDFLDWINIFISPCTLISHGVTYWKILFFLIEEDSFAMYIYVYAPNGLAYLSN